jgi:hypothetical protein
MGKKILWGGLDSEGFLARRRIGLPGQHYDIYQRGTKNGRTFRILTMWHAVSRA